MKRFKSARRALGDLDADGAGALLASAGDIAVIVDTRGIVRDVAFGSDDLAAALDTAADWTGKPLIDAVTPETQAKMSALLAEAARGEGERPRQVNHPTGAGDIPVLYHMAPAGRGGRFVAFGRDLRPLAAVQQRLVNAQQSLERDYARLRQAESRYRLLFQVSGEGVLVVDAATLKILEANPAAENLLGETAKTLTGRSFPHGFDARANEPLRALLATARSVGRAEDLRVTLADGEREVSVRTVLFRQENNSLFLVRLVPTTTRTDVEPATSRGRLLEAAEHTPDAIVVTDAGGRILAANRAFLDLAQLPTELQARGETLDRWLGHAGVDIGVMIASIRQNGALRLFATTIRGEYGLSADVEISAGPLPGSDETTYAFAIRNVARRLSAEPRVAGELPRSVSQLTELVGRVSLKDLVREATDVIERLSIEAALELTSDNRASAAEMLGLSRQSLYVKLRRYGLGDLAQQESD
ncbi:MAG: transcriptional regulator PpsR [Vicinamibacterales bacterium]